MLDYFGEYFSIFSIFEAVRCKNLEKSIAPFFGETLMSSLKMVHEIQKNSEKIELFLKNGKQNLEKNCHASVFEETLMSSLKMAHG